MRRSSVLLGLCAFLACVVVGCGSTNGGSGTPGDGGGGGGGEVPACAADFVEPSLAYDASRCPVDEALKETYFYAGLCLPEEAGSGALHAQYWLTGGEVPCFRFEVGIGRVFPSDSIAPIRLVALVDGRQVPFSVDGAAPSSVHLLPLIPHSDDAAAVLELCLDGEMPPEGLHLVTILPIFVGRWDSSSLGINVPAVRDSTCVSDTRPPVTSPTIGEGEGPGTWIEDAEYGFPLLPGNGYRPIEGGRLPIRIHLHRDASDGSGVEALLVAMLDDEVEIPLGELGHAPRLLAPENIDDGGIFEVTLEDLPRDGQKHRLSIVQLGGFGQTAMDSDGSRLPFPAYADQITSFNFAEE